MKTRQISCGRTDPGRVRPRNEDRFFTDDERALFAVADGMGGHAAGEIASEMALDVIRDYLARRPGRSREPVGEPDPRLSEGGNQLASAVRLANHVIYQAQRERKQWRGMGTTVVAAWRRDRRLLVAHVGDSRAYLVRDGRLKRLTRDHSVVEEQVRQGLMTSEEAERSGARHIITRALGHGERVEVDVGEFDVRDNDRLLLCTDGLTDMVPDRIILSVVLSAEEPGSACDMLIDVANKSGGRDNIAVVLVHFFEKNWRYAVRSLYEWSRR